MLEAIIITAIWFTAGFFAGAAWVYKRAERVIATAEAVLDFYAPEGAALAKTEAGESTSQDENNL